MWSIEFSKTHRFQIHNKPVKQKFMSDFWNVCFCVCDCAARCWEVYRHWKALPLPEAAFWSQQWQWQKVRVRLHDRWLQCCCAARGLLLLSWRYGLMARQQIKKQKNNMQVTIFTVPSRQSFVHCFISIFTLLFFFLKEVHLNFCRPCFSSCVVNVDDEASVDILLYLVVCVSFVSPYLFITHTPPRPPQFGPFGLRMPGGRPLLDYGINLLLF